MKIDLNLMYYLLKYTLICYKFTLQLRQKWIDLYFGISTWKLKIKKCYLIQDLPLLL